MKQHYTDEKTGISYTLQGDYYLPDLILPAEEEERHIGVWGQRHAKYLKQNHKVLYMNSFTSGKLSSHLADVDEQAQEMFSRLVNQMAEREGVTEQLKLENQMKWVARMNNIQSRAAEIVNHDIIYN